jgi:hypothetical protein
MLNFISAAYTPGDNDRAYTHASRNYQAPYTTVAYTDLISLFGSSLVFLPNHAYQHAPRVNAYNQLEADGFGSEISHHFPFRPQSIDMTSA